MDMNAYHRAWMAGASEAEAVRAGEDAWEEAQIRNAQMQAEYEAEAFADLIAEHEARMIKAHEDELKANKQITTKGEES
jgi:hypothetical protein